MVVMVTHMIVVQILLGEKQSQALVRKRIGISILHLLNSQAKNSSSLPSSLMCLFDLVGSIMLTKSQNP